MAIAAVVALGTFTAKANNAQTILPVQVQQIVASVDAGTTITIQEEEELFHKEEEKVFPKEEEEVSHKEEQEVSPK